MSSRWLFITFLLALAGTLGSLYFSEVLKLPPCPMCWYQRIALYPLTLVYGTALWTGDQAYRKYATPLIAAGLGLALYHNLIYYGVIPEALAPCTREVSCAARQLELLGFVTIPLMSLLCFALLAALTVLDRKGRT